MRQSLAIGSMRLTSRKEQRSTAHSRVVAAEYGVRPQSGPLCPSAGAISDSFMAYPDRAAGVFQLFVKCCPVAVARLVVSVHVITLDRMLGGRSRPHVRQEVAEASEPALADENPPTAVSAIASIAWIQAAVFHPAPDPPLGDLLGSGWIDMPCRLFVPRAPGTFALAEIPGVDGFFATALAPAKPELGCVGVSDDCPASEGAASQILALVKRTVDALALWRTEVKAVPRKILFRRCVQFATDLAGCVDYGRHLTSSIQPVGIAC